MYKETYRRKSADFQVAFSGHELSLMKDSQPASRPPGVTVPLLLELLAPAVSIWPLENSSMVLSHAERKVDVDAGADDIVVGN